MKEPESEPEQLDLPERSPRPAPATPNSAPTPLWPAKPTRNSIVIGGACQRANDETRLGQIHCGHAIGMPLSQCVCEQRLSSA